MSLDLKRLAVELRELKPNAGSTVIVAVDGCGGAGKTTFAAQLSQALGGAPLLHTDDFASWEAGLSWWPRLLEQVLEPLVRDEPGCYQRYDWRKEMLDDWHDVPTSGILLIEGVSSSRREFRPYLSFSIWIDCPRDVRLARGLERNGPDSLPSWEQWMTEEDIWVARDQPRNHVNLVVDGQEPYDV